jgi:hypothetical protein
LTLPPERRPPAFAARQSAASARRRPARRFCTSPNQKRRVGTGAPPLDFSVGGSVKKGSDGSDGKQQKNIQQDLKALTDPRVKKLIRERGIILTTWKEMKERRKKAAMMEWFEALWPQPGVS